MDKGWLLLIVLGLAAVLGVVLRNRFLAPGTPFRGWFEATLGPLARKALTVLFYVTVAIWLAIWATAGEDDRTRLGREFREFLKSVEWGSKDAGEKPAAPLARDPAMEKMP
ncbi:MAG: hypothetical protein COW30_02230 [Rhodospirillales bacterium CG15_BIG_FIL_POST_REV_8_21_14_020_66_15]|nr:MAG: hypothetical protein COW30_02230 [Rhodospirillales bacterium CG15_BIG_FIL_POST_REV_8_21_14_020_66_15]